MELWLKTLRELLEAKCLYQNIEVPEASAIYVDEITQLELGPTAYFGGKVLPVPTINSRCRNCGDSTFLNHSLRFFREGSANSHFLNGATQVFSLLFKCAHCQHGIVFLVSRRGRKLQLVGRSEPFRPPLDPIFRAPLREIVQDALNATAEGDVPAGYYHLRTAIEHHMKTSLGIDLNSRIDGSDLCETFATTVDSDVSSRFQSFKEIYEEMSAGLHTRVVSANRIHEIINNIEKRLKYEALSNKFPKNSA